MLACKSTRIIHKNGYVIMEQREFEKLQKELKEKISGTARMIRMRDYPEIIDEGTIKEFFI